MVFIGVFFIIELFVLFCFLNIVKEGLGVREVVIMWLLWSKVNGDVGELFIMWYSIWFNIFGLGWEEKVGIVIYFNCGKECNFIIEELEFNMDYGVWILIWRDGEGGEGIFGLVRKFCMFCVGELFVMFF